MKKIYCGKCGKKVGELAKGSTWRKESKGICGGCIKAMKIEAFKKQMSDVSKSQKPMGSLFGNLFG